MAVVKHTQCIYCGGPKKSEYLKFCCQECRGAYTRREKLARQQEQYTANRKTMELYVRRPKRVIITDEEQYKINRAVDAKHDSPCLCKTYKPGDPGFEALAAQVTPIERVRFPAWQPADPVLALSGVRG